MELGSPIDFFNILFNDDMWTVMTSETNKFAQRKISETALKPHSRLQKWQDVSVDEMKVFLALVIAMGLVVKTDIDRYWSTSEVISTPFFGKTMSKDRFLAILSNFHLTDNTSIKLCGEMGYDPLAKVRPFISMTRRNFVDKYDPECDLSFDEATCPFKGRIKFKVYNPAKPAKFGIKLYQVCESSSGYCCGYDIYTGAKKCDDFCENYADLVIPDNDFSTTTKTVIGLLAYCGLLHEGHHVYMDNYYNSPEIFDHLYYLNTFACGTVRLNRNDMPDALQKNKVKLAPGTGIYRRRDHLLALKFHDKRDINMLSTIHDAECYVFDKKDKEGNYIVKPVCIAEYIKKMGGVDLSDQVLQYYTVLRKTVKWWRKLFFHLLNLLVTNAYILHQKYSKKMSHHDFRMKLVEELIKSAPLAPKPRRPGRKSGESLDRLTGRHFAEENQGKPGAKRKVPMRDCKACNPSKKQRTSCSRKQTAYHCPDCNVALCFPKCFKAYHTRTNYKSYLVETDSESDSEYDSDTQEES